MDWRGVASTAEDLARCAKSLYEGRAFGNDYLKQMEAGDELREGLGSGYGLATQVWKTDFGTSYGHGPNQPKRSLSLQCGAADQNHIACLNVTDESE